MIAGEMRRWLHTSVHRRQMFICSTQAGVWNQALLETVVMENFQLIFLDSSGKYIMHYRRRHVKEKV